MKNICVDVENRWVMFQDGVEWRAVLLSADGNITETKYAPTFLQLSKIADFNIEKLVIIPEAQTVKEIYTIAVEKLRIVNEHPELTEHDKFIELRGAAIRNLLMPRINELLLKAVGMGWDDLPDTNSFWQYIFEGIEPADYDELVILAAKERVLSAGSMGIEQINKAFAKALKE